MNRENPTSIYAPPRRSSLLLWSALYGIGAGFAWWAAHWLEGSWIMILVAIPAVGLSLLCFNLLLQLPAPGKTIKIFSSGIAIGKTTIPWPDLDEVFYSVESILRRETGSSHDEIRMRFCRANDPPIEIHLSNETLPFYLNLEELLQTLKQQNIRVTDEHGPIEHRDGATSRTTVRNPELAQSLREEFSQAFARIGEHTDKAELIQNVIGSLARGETERKKIRFRCLLRLIREKLLEIVATSGGFVLFLAIVPFAASALNEVANLFRGNAHPELVIRLPLFLFGTIACWWCGKQCWLFVEKKSTSSRKLLSVYRSVHKPVPVAESDLTGPYALYLRSFSGEYFRYLQTTENKGNDGLRVKYETLQREVDTTIVTFSTDRSLPLFALANAQDASASGDIRALYVPTQNWVDLAAVLVWHSKKIILNLSALTESVLAELWAVDQIEAHHRTFVIIGSEFDIARLTAPEKKLLEKFPFSSTESSETLPDELIRFADGQHPPEH